jgi:tryprostatin B 6-hydroxylase
LERAVRNEFQAEKHVGTTTGNSIVHWLYKIYQREADPATNPLFRVDARLLIMAGSETTAAALTFLFYLLAKHPHHVLELRRELQGKQIGADSSLIKCEHLNAFIKESLRLYPPGPSGVFRLTPPEGLRVGATQIPGSTNIQLPVYSIHRGGLHTGFASSVTFTDWCR